MQCPDCGGDMWDNRHSKRNPKQPDYKCKNKQCDKAVWEKPGANAAPAPASSGNGHTPAASHDKRAIGPIYNDCLAFAKAACAHHFGDKAETSDVIAAAATLFIQAVRDGSPIRAPKAPARPAAPPPPPPPPVEPFDPYREADDLPF